MATNIRETVPARPGTDKGWTEPESAASLQYPPKYPYNTITQTKSGHMFEMDDTPQGERVRIHHRSGTFIEMHPNGDEVHKIYGDGYEIVAKNKNVLIKGVCNITVEGDSIFHVKGNRTEMVDGNYNLVVKGDYSLVGKDTVTIGAKDKVSIKGDILSLKTDTINITGDLNVDGALEAYTVGCVRIDSRCGGTFGIFDPGNPLKGRLPSFGTGIFVHGTITSLIAVIAPLGTFGIMGAIFMTDIINTALHNCHIHIGFKGPTGPPIPPMI
jgi:hypothetical protein